MAGGGLSLQLLQGTWLFLMFSSLFLKPMKYDKWLFEKPAYMLSRAMLLNVLVNRLWI